MSDMVSDHWCVPVVMRQMFGFESRMLARTFAKVGTVSLMFFRAVFLSEEQTF